MIDALNTVVERHPRWGFDKCFRFIRNQGHRWNHKRVWRVYCNLGLNLKRKVKKRLPIRARQPLDVPPKPNHTWSMDFMSDTLYTGMRYRTLNILDEGVREALRIEVDTSLPAARVVRILEQLKQERGLPQTIRVDNGPEFIAQSTQEWCTKNHVTLQHIQPGKPNQNAYIERFNRSFREELLDANLFMSLEQVRDMSWAWMLSYNEERPHQSLGNIPPAQFRRQIMQENSTFNL